MYRRYRLRRFCTYRCISGKSCRRGIRLLGISSTCQAYLFYRGLRRFCMSSLAVVCLRNRFRSCRPGTACTTTLPSSSTIPLLRIRCTGRGSSRSSGPTPERTLCRSSHLRMSCSQRDMRHIFHLSGRYHPHKPGKQGDWSFCQTCSYCSLVSWQSRPCKYSYGRRNTVQPRRRCSCQRSRLGGRPRTLCR